jgi:nucleoside 2-deoxyribosyltransferase
MKTKVYLAGQSNQYDSWRSEFKKLEGFEFYDPDIDSDQSSPETFFPQDLEAIQNADILVANPGTKPSEGTWIEIGYFLALNTKTPGETCKNMIIIWSDDREPKWSIEFVKKAGKVVSSAEEAVKELQKLHGLEVKGAV